MLLALSILFLALYNPHASSLTVFVVAPSGFEVDNTSFVEENTSVENASMEAMPAIENGSILTPPAESDEVEPLPEPTPQPAPEPIAQPESKSAVESVPSPQPVPSGLQNQGLETEGLSIFDFNSDSNFGNSEVQPSVTQGTPTVDMPRYNGSNGAAGEFGASPGASPVTTGVSCTQITTRNLQGTVQLESANYD